MRLTEGTRRVLVDGAGGGLLLLRLVVLLLVLCCAAADRLSRRTVRRAELSFSSPSS